MWTFAIDKTTGKPVEFYATAGDYYTENSFFCTYLAFNEKVGLEVAMIGLDNLEIIAD